MIFKKIKKRTYIMMLFSGVLIYGSSCDNTINDDSYNTVEDSNLCLCDSSWFPHAQTPPTNDGIGGPFDTNSTTNCQFHQWSWQKFLWLTRMDANGIAFFQNNLIQAGGALDSVAPFGTDTVMLEDVFQAGSHGILTTNAAYNSAHNVPETLYYSIHVNQQMYDAAKLYGNTILNDTALTNNNFTFPVGALELKVSWVNVEAIPANIRSSYYTTVAKIGNNTLTVALLGMHVVGRVINHPEFIWATFEHKGMSPDVDWSSSDPNTVSSSSETLLFAQGSTTSVGGISWNDTTSMPYTPFKAYNLYPFGVPRTTGGAYMSTSQQEPENFNNIGEINACVNQNLNGDVWQNYFYKGSIWINMDGLSEQQQIDRIISQGYNIGNLSTDTFARGSLGISNVTMETFTQEFAPYNSSITSINKNFVSNCFSCHNGESTDNFNGEQFNNVKSPLYLSHLFNSYLGTLKGTPKKDARMVHVKEFYQLKKERQQNTN